MSDDEEPGSDKVTASTRAFEQIDAQIFPGPGRGATQNEAAASDRWGGPSPATVDAYRRMVDRVVKHRLAHQSRAARPGVQSTKVESSDHTRQRGESTCLTTAATARAR